MRVQLLQKHGLSEDAGEKQLAKVKARLGKERELEGAPCRLLWSACVSQAAQLSLRWQRLVCRTPSPALH